MSTNPLTWLMRILKSAERLHGGQLVILWIVLAGATTGAFFALESFVSWRSDRFEERVENERIWREQDVASCKDSAVVRVPQGRVAARYQTLRGDTWPPAARNYGTLFYALDTLRRNRARKELQALNDSLISARSDIQPAIDSLLAAQRVCDELPYFSEFPPRSRPFELLFIALALLSASLGLASTWFWLGARKST